MNRTFLRQILLSSKLFITADGYNSAMMDCFPLLFNADPVPGSLFIVKDPPTYKETCTKVLNVLKQELSAHSELQGINVTDDFHADDLPEGSIAYHRVWGFVTAASCWHFSTKQFEQDLLVAESNPGIACHFLHVNTPGGEAWYLDRLSETMRSLAKPVFVFIENVCASAGYFIACHGTTIHALTRNDQIGCIGTMLEYLDFQGYYEKLGLKVVRVKADQSDLKNKKVEDLIDGHPEQYRKDILNPLAEQFISEVRSCRSTLTDLPEDDPVFRGETFDTNHAIENGLIDGTSTFPQALVAAYQLAQGYLANETLKQRALNLL